MPLGFRFIDSLNEMRKVQWSSREELHARNEARLGLLLKHDVANVPYYRDLYRRLHLKPDELRTIPDLKALPIFRKSDYRKCGPETLCASNIKRSLHKRAIVVSALEPRLAPRQDGHVEVRVDDWWGKGFRRHTKTNSWGLA